MKIVIVIVILTAVLFSNGCAVIAQLGTPSPHEIKIPAEFDLAAKHDQRILVLVEQPRSLNTSINLRALMTQKINQYLGVKIEIPPESLIDYSRVSQYLSTHTDSLFLEPIEAAKSLDANSVLLVSIVKFQLNEIEGSGYYKGQLEAHAALFDTATEAKLWPQSQESKSIKVGFEIEQRGRDIAVDRLNNAFAHCITRYLYNCPKDQFKIYDDRSGIAWETWGQ